MSNVIAFPSPVAAPSPAATVAFRPATTPARRTTKVALPDDPAKGLFRTWLDRIRHRRDLRRLAMAQPDSVLEDVGLSRGQVYAEADKPFWRA
jgi:uncharacterized protein YjiS (DUF1127 family)